MQLGQTLDVLWESFFSPLGPVSELHPVQLSLVRQPIATLQCSHHRILVTMAPHQHVGQDRHGRPSKTHRKIGSLLHGGPLVYRCQELELRVICLPCTKT